MGASKLLLEQDLHSEVLKDAIMSPRGFQSIQIDVIEAIIKKSQFLGQNNRTLFVQ